MAKALLGTIASHFPSVLVVLDAWYMKRRLVLWAVDRSIAVIGQIRRDSALFRIPSLLRSASEDVRRNMVIGSPARTWTLCQSRRSRRQHTADG